VKKENFLEENTFSAPMAESRRADEVPKVAHGNLSAENFHRKKQRAAPAGAAL
jgi:hypothetical protein